jgi:hypothetical protein
LWAGTAIAEAGDHLEISVDTLSARANNGGIHLLEANAVTVDDVEISISKVGTRGTAAVADGQSVAASGTVVVDASQSDLRTGGNGNIILRTTAGDITLNDGTAADDDTAISANGSGNILIQTLGSNTDITANADILSGSGNISVLAARSISFTGTADLRTGSAGSINVEAGTGSIAQAHDSLFTTGSGVSSSACNAASRSSAPRSSTAIRNAHAPSTRR